MFKWIITLLLGISCLFSPQAILAQEKNQFITIVNPVRISTYSPDPPNSLSNQYQLVKSNNLAASWLLTYDVLENPEIIELLKQMDDQQDVGIWLEVTENFATKAGVNYNKTDSWHRSTSVFLSGYNQSDRIKLINLVFEKFKEQMGHYPTSIGSWWTDSYSLDYMQKRYQVSANLVVADQLDTDGYTIWGQYFAVPYYPSRNHSAVPAQNLSNKIPVVNMQWAPRDPINGYISPTQVRASLYSTQDYYTNNLKADYLDKLVNLYAKKHQNKFGQITFGLEGDFAPGAYTSGTQYGHFIQTAKKFSDTGEFLVVNMNQFSKWYQTNFDISPNHLINTSDLLGKNLEVVWYQTPRYRVAFLMDKDTDSLRLLDLRTYFGNFQEPFYTSTNKQLDLYTKLPGVIDSASAHINKIIFEDITLKKLTKQDKSLEIIFNNNQVINLTEDQIVFSNFQQKLPNFIYKSSYLKKLSSPNDGFLIAERFPFDPPGYIFSDLTPQALHFLQQKRIILLAAFLLVITILIFYIIFKSNLKHNKKISLQFILITLILILGFIFYKQNSTDYLVGQAELDALFTLKTQPKGRVLVLDRECLQCHYLTKYQPAALANIRSYVTKISQKEVVKDAKLIESYSEKINHPTQLSINEVKSYLKNLDVDYIYLVKHQDYKEKLPYSPGDLGVEEIYTNADSQIFRVLN